MKLGCGVSNCPVSALRAELTTLIRLQAGVLLLPAIEGLLADPHSPISSATGIPISGLFHNGQDLLHRKPFPLHSANSSFVGICRNLALQLDQLSGCRSAPLPVRFRIGASSCLPSFLSFWEMTYRKKAGIGMAGSRDPSVE